MWDQNIGYTCKQAQLSLCIPPTCWCSGHIIISTRGELFEVSNFCDKNGVSYWNRDKKKEKGKSWTLNSLAPGRPGCHFKTAIFQSCLLIGIFTSSKDNALRWMPWDLTDDKSTLVQVMAWCRQATSHYLSQCWPSSMSPYMASPAHIELTFVMLNLF